MLDSLKKGFSEQKLSAELEQIQELSAALEGKEQELLSLNSELSSLKSELTLAKSALDDAQKQLKDIVDEKVKAEAEAAEKKLAARKLALENAVGSEKAGELFSAISGLEDKAFDTILSTFSLSVDKEEVNFKANGADGDATEAALQNQPTHFKKFMPKNK